MADIMDVAKYILNHFGENKITTMKLQKLLYYCQAWSLVWDDKPMFPDRIEAWSNGPVIPAIFYQHRGQYYINSRDIAGNSENLLEIEVETINAVLGLYGDKTSLWLSRLSHSEQPWIEAREGIPLGSRSNNEITHESMAEYYQSISL